MEKSAHRAATAEGDGVFGEAQLLDAGHRCELDRLQTRQIVMREIEPLQAFQVLEDPGLDRRDEIVREVQLLKRYQRDKPLISHCRDAVVWQAEFLQMRQTGEAVVGDVPDATVEHVQAGQGFAVLQEGPIRNALYRRLKDQNIVDVGFSVR